mmetsp:Transcript_9558/g.31775  ORF Transcript_9558/g.31775 Transcript_9558/m.31775 type:complete len:939 (+) Transcript_9558:38-2854(+)
MVDGRATSKSRRPARAPLGERNDDADEAVARRQGSHAAHLVSMGLAGIASASKTGYHVASAVSKAGMAAIRDKQNKPPKPVQAVSVPPGGLTGLSHGNSVHLEALAALAAVDGDLCALESPDIVRPPALTPSGTSGHHQTLLNGLPSRGAITAATKLERVTPPSVEGIGVAPPRPPAVAFLHCSAAISRPLSQVVIGTQSSGKSSLINALTGFDLMPTGTGMVTQAPLRLILQHSANVDLVAELGPQLPRFPRVDTINSPSGGVAYQPFPGPEDGPLGQPRTGGTFVLSVPPTPEQQQALRDAICAVSRALAGNGKSVTRETISLRLTSSRLPNLSLIDLPGLTSVPLVSMGQPENIRHLLRELATSFAANPRATIVLVSQATGDLEADQAFELVRSIDPRLERTVGVLTKADLATRDADAERVVNFLTGNSSAELVPKRGRFAVCLRAGATSQVEQHYFEHSMVGSRARAAGCAAVLGVPSLAKHLSKLAISQLDQARPAILQQAEQMRLNAQRRLAVMAPAVPTDETSRHLMLNTLLMHTAREVEGAHTSASRPTGYRMKLAFERLEAALNRLDPFGDLPGWELEVHEAVRNHEGWMVSLLAPKNERSVLLAPPALSAAAKAEQAANNAGRTVGLSGSIFPSDVRLEGLMLAHSARSPVEQANLNIQPAATVGHAGASTSSGMGADDLDKTQEWGEPPLKGYLQDIGYSAPIPAEPAYPQPYNQPPQPRNPAQSRRGSLMDDELSRGFLPKDVIQLLLGTQSSRRPLRQLFDPCAVCLREVAAELRAVVETLQPRLARFPKLAAAVRTKVTGLIDQLALETEMEITKLIDVEESYVFVTKALLRRMEKQGAYGTPCAVLKAYFEDVRQAVAKAVPKLVISHLAKQLEVRVGEELFSVHYTPGLLEEANDEAIHRQGDERMVQQLIRVEEAFLALRI